MWNLEGGSDVIISILKPLQDTMHSVSGGLLMPTIAVLLLMLAFTVVEIGGLITEIIFERRKVHINVPRMINAFQDKTPEEVLGDIDQSGLFRRQKAALRELIDNRTLPVISLQAIARRLLAQEELHYAKITSRTDLIARVGPMFGLMATLIPLGPGLIAMGQGDTKTLADSLLTAFDATVAGLAAAAICFGISRLRRRWYEDYMSSLEALMESLLEVFARERGIKE